MSLRVTPQISLNNAIKNSQRHTSALADLQQQASTGIRLQKPSDDPLATRSLLSHQSLVTRLETQVSNIEQSRGVLNTSVSHLLDANDVLVRAKEIALTSDSFDERLTLADEVDNLINRLKTIGNAQFGDRYLFGGIESDSPPFTETIDANGVRTVTYQGGEQESRAQIGETDLELMLVGSSVFDGAARESTLYIGNTGATSGAGVDSATGVGELSVRHVATTYSGASGIAVGTSSAAGDTVIGPSGAHTLTISSANTISLNGGPAVAFDRTETNLEITGPNGEKVFVDTTSVVGGFDGTIDIAASGAISIDGGATETAIDFSGNQALTNSATGAVTHVNSSQIRSAGSDSVEYVGASDVFEVLTQLRDDLRNTRGLSESELTDAFQRRIADVDRVRDHISLSIVQQSTSLENLDALQSRAEDLKLETTSSISDLESADIAEVALRLQNTQALLQFTLSATASMFDVSLLNYLG